MTDRNNPKRGRASWTAVLLASAVAAFLALAPAIAAENEVDLQRTRITSDKVIYTGNEEIIVFEENVHVQRSDFELWCRRMTVHLTDGGAPRGEGRGNAPENFEKIVAEEDVRLRMEGRNATCRKAVYHSGEEMITLSGDVRLQQGRNRIRGQRVRMDLAGNTTEIVGSGKEQVEATFYSENSTVPSNGASEGN